MLNYVNVYRTLCTYMYILNNLRVKGFTTFYVWPPHKNTAHIPEMYLYNERCTPSDNNKHTHTRTHTHPALAVCHTPKRSANPDGGAIYLSGVSFSRLAKVGHIVN